MFMPLGAAFFYLIGEISGLGSAPQESDEIIVSQFGGYCDAHDISSLLTGSSAVVAAEFAGLVAGRSLCEPGQRSGGRSGFNGVLYERYEGDGRRKSSYEPRMMVKLLIYGYATGVFSSRGIASKGNPMDLRYALVRQAKGAMKERL